jgi:hypothetical protein
MTKQAYNSNTAKSIGTMNLNVGKRRHIDSQVENMSQIMKEKPHNVCFSHAIILKNNTKISCCWIVDATITWKITNIYFHALIL